VLPSLRDRYTAGFCPDRVVFARRKRGLGRVVDLKHIEPCPPEEPGAPAWLEPLNALERVLKRADVRSGTLTVVLSNHFVRYLLIPWNDEIASREEFDNYARACFENVFGPGAQSWEVRVAPGKAGTPRLGCAIDRELLGALRHTAGTSALKLISIQPYLMAAYNRLSWHFARGDFVFLLVEQGRACLLSALGERWQSVRSAAVADAESAVALLEREMQLLDAGTAPPQVFVHAPDAGKLKLPRFNNEKPQFLVFAPLEGFVPDQEGAYSMALAA